MALPFVRRFGGLKRPRLRSLMLASAGLAAVITGGTLWPEFFDLTSFLLVLGGAVTVTCCSYSKRELRELWQQIKNLFAEQRETFQDQVGELSRLTGLFHRDGLRGLEDREAYLKDPFLKQGVGLIVDLNTEEKIRARLESLLASILGRYEVSRQILLTLGKLLPSFGLIGTLIGMVLLLKNISGQDSRTLPAALGLAVLTTLYGAVLANVVVAPLIARLQAVALEKERRMRLTLDWVLMIVRGEAVAAIADRLGVPVTAIDTGKRQALRWQPAARSLYARQLRKLHPQGHEDREGRIGQ